MTQPTSESPKSGWKTQLYLVGALLGAAMGFLSAYLFAQEAEHEGEAQDRPKVQPTALLGVALSVITVVRQIAETGRKKDNKKK